MLRSDDPLLGAHLEEWLERQRVRLRPSTVDSYSRCISTYLRPQLGEVPLSALDRRMLERHYARLVDAGGCDGQPLSVRTVQKVHTVLRSALRDAQLRGLIAHNPAQAARPPKRNPNAVEIDDSWHMWRFDQAAHFLRSVADHRWRALWHVALGTGARRSELLGLRWKDVDLDAGMVVIRRGLTVVDRIPRLLRNKTSGVRTLAVGSSVVEELGRWREQQRTYRDRAADWQDRWGLVFTQENGKHLNPDVVTKEFRRLVQVHDVPAIRLHDLRHTHASLLLAIGVPAKVISDRLGHASISTTMDIYAHLLPAMDQHAAAEFHAALTNADR